MERVAVPLCKPDVGAEELAAIRDVFEAGTLSHGPAVAQFEADFARHTGTAHAIALNSCTSGLHLACAWIRETKGEGEVVVPSFTFVASENSIATGGLRPRFVDVEWKTGNTTAALIEPVIGKNTRAIMVVHYAGRPCDMPAITALAKKHGLVLIEDSAECLGAAVEGKQVGSYGIGVFSFYGTKNITTGEGGMITTDDAEFADWLRLRIAHGVKKGSYKRDGISHGWYRNAVVPGHNFRLSNLQCAMGVVQLRRLAGMNANRTRVARQYHETLQKTAGVELPEMVADGAHSWQMYAVKVDERKRDAVLLHLNEQGVGASVHFDPPAHLQTAYSVETLSLPVTEKLSRSTITLPIGALQTPEQTRAVTLAVTEALVRG